MGLIVFLPLGVFADCIDEIVKHRATNQGDFKTAKCFHEHKLYSESLPFLIRLSPSHSQSFEYLIDHLPSGYESIIESFLLKIKPKTLNRETYEEFIYWRVKGLNRKGKYRSVLKLTKNFNKTHPRFLHIQFYKAVALLNVNRINKAKVLFEFVKSQLKARKSKKEQDLFFLDIISSSLGKIYLTQKKYKKAEGHYKDIRTESMIWYDNLVELGWNQLKGNNFSKALGNMYFIEKNTSPVAWKPDSYLIRAVSFLRLCHFGDANSALKVIEKFYAPLYQVARKSRVSNYYTLLKSSLDSKLDGYIQGFPVPLVRYAATDIDFIQVQESINNLIDEIEAQEKLEKKIVKRIRIFEKDKLKNIEKEAQLKEKIFKLKAKKASSNRILKKEEKLRDVQNALRAIDTGVSSLNDGVSFHLSKLSKKIKKLKSLIRKFEKKAHRILKQKVKSTLAQLKERLNQAELIRFEIYSRSGNNIRYRLEGGRISKKRRDDLFKVFGSKELKWNFNGEVWKDEYGSLNTAITDLCKQ